MKDTFEETITAARALIRNTDHYLNVTRVHYPQSRQIEIVDLLSRLQDTTRAWVSLQFIEEKVDDPKFSILIREVHQAINNLQDAITDMVLD